MPPFRRLVRRFAFLLSLPDTAGSESTLVLQSHHSVLSAPRGVKCFILGDLGEKRDRRMEAWSALLEA